MSWQEELRRLDAELAAGRLGQAEHRRQRDELLAEASGGGAVSPLRQDAPTWSTPDAQATAPASWAGSEASAGTAGATPLSSFAAQDGATGTDYPQGSFAAPGGAAGTAYTPGSMPASSFTAQPDASPGSAAPTYPAATHPGNGTTAYPGNAGPANTPAGGFGQPGNTSPASPDAAAPAAPHSPATGFASPAPAYQPAPAKQGTWAGVPPVQWHTTGQSQSQPPARPQPSAPSAGWASTNPAIPPSEPAAVEAFLSAAATTSISAPDPAKARPPFSHTPSGSFVTDRPTTAPSPADDRPTAVFGVVGGDAGDGQPAPRRLYDENDKPRGSKPTWLFLSLAVLVVLALVVGVIWFIGSKNDDTAAPPPPASSSAPNTQPASLEDKLPVLPGTPSQQNSTMALDKAVQAKAVSDADANLMRAAGADQLVYHSYGATEGGTTLLAVPTPSKQQAADLVKGLRQNLTTGGFASSPLGPSGADSLYTGSSPAGQVLAYWYTSGPVAVGIGVSGPAGKDPAALKARMEQIRAKLAATLPAG